MLSRQQLRVVRLRALGLGHKQIEAEMGLAQGVSKVYLSRAAAGERLDVRALIYAETKREFEDRLRTVAYELFKLADYPEMPEGARERLRKMALGLSAGLLGQQTGPCFRP